MSHKSLFAVGSMLLLLALAAWGAAGQEQIPQMPIVTTASNVVGIGTYVAAQAYAIPAGQDPATQPVQAIILPYGIYPNMMVENIEDFQEPAALVEGFTFTWNLTVPAGSAAELGGETVAHWLADVEGQYVLTLTATDEAGNTATTEWVVTATTYVGVGGIVGDAEEPQCSSCHEETAAAWAATGHATMFTRAIDGLVSNHYSAECITCHTTGFNNRPEAVNGGFDDVAAEIGWTFPETLQPGNWDAMVAEFPQVAALANIQCESCHGPGGAHQAAAGGDDEEESAVSQAGPIGRGLAYGTCAQCHAEEPYHTFPQQWELSAHAAANARAFTYPIGPEEADCVRCHSGAGYIDFTQGIPPEESRTNYQVITCAVCHDPHDAANPNQLRTFDSVLLPGDIEVAGAGPAATCMSCHNARTAPVAAVEGETFRTPHYSTAAELMNATGGYTWGMNLPTSTHGRVVEDSCIGCHMAPTPGMDADGNPLPGHETVGEHTFAMISPVDGTENVAVCQQCHDAAESFTFEARRDYDGDGAIESNQDEVAGLRAILQAALEAQGVVVLDHYPYFQLPENPSVDLKGAVYNFKFTADVESSAIHNLRYVVSLLQLSYERLTGEPVPGATIIPPRE